MRRTLMFSFCLFSSDSGFLMPPLQPLMHRRSCHSMPTSEPSQLPRQSWTDLMLLLAAKESLIFVTKPPSTQTHPLTSTSPPPRRHPVVALPHERDLSRHHLDIQSAHRYRDKEDTHREKEIIIIMLMLTMRPEAEDSIPKTNPNPEPIQGTPKVSFYEQCREERIKENLQRMQNLGILDLSRKLPSETRTVKRPYTHSNSAQESTPPLQPSRRSSRLENSTPVIYPEPVSTRCKSSKRRSVVVYEGIRPEIYTEEHEKLLGNTERSWTCFVDGYGKDGKRIYDPVNGKTCHQCRQKTLGHRTRCSECDMVQGQFCGDCLFMRYGEHVLEALENTNWVCPPCRGICNCSLCRNQRGWVPTGQIYRRIANLGYKSVAHYLVQTKQMRTYDDDDDATPNQASARRSLSFQEDKPLVNISGDILQIENGDSLKNEEDETSAKRSLSFNLPSVDDETRLVDVQVLGYLEPPKQDKQEHTCANDLARNQEKTGQDLNSDTGPDSSLLFGENKILVVDSEGIIRVWNAREMRSKRKAAAQEPNPDSIGGRLRQRRRSNSGI